MQARPGAAMLHVHPAAPAVPPPQLPQIRMPQIRPALGDRLTAASTRVCSGPDAVPRAAARQAEKRPRRGPSGQRPGACVPHTRRCSSCLQCSRLLLPRCHPPRCLHWARRGAPRELLRSWGKKLEWSPEGPREPQGCASARRQVPRLARPRLFACFLRRRSSSRAPLPSFAGQVERAGTWMDIKE